MKDSKREEVKIYADLILKELSSENSLILSQFEERNPFISKYETAIYEVIDYLKKEELITFFQGYSENSFYNQDNGTWDNRGELIEKITITDKGILLREQGGIIKSEKDIKDDKIRKRNVDRVNIWVGIIGIFGGFLGGYTFFNDLNKEANQKNEFNLMKSKIDSLNQNQKYLEVENKKHFDSLYNEINKLNKK